MRRVALLLLMALAAGCTFHRAVTNAYVRDLDTSWIRPGKTTSAEVVERLGLPPRLQGVDGYTSDTLHYVCMESFEAKVEIGYILTPTFSRSHECDGEDVLIAFDEAGVVRFVSRTRIRRTPIGGRPSVDVREFRGNL